MSSLLNTGVNKNQESLEGSHPTSATGRRPSIEVIEYDLNTDLPDTLPVKLHVPVSEQEDSFWEETGFPVENPNTRDSSEDYKLLVRTATHSGAGCRVLAGKLMYLLSATMYLIDEQLSLTGDVSEVRDTFQDVNYTWHTHTLAEVLPLIVVAAHLIDAFYFMGNPVTGLKTYLDSAMGRRRTPIKGVLTNILKDETPTITENLIMEFTVEIAAQETFFRTHQSSKVFPGFSSKLSDIKPVSITKSCLNGWKLVNVSKMLEDKDSRLNIVREEYFAWRQSGGQVQVLDCKEETPLDSTTVSAIKFLRMGLTLGSIKTPLRMLASRSIGFLAEKTLIQNQPRIEELYLQYAVPDPVGVSDAKIRKLVKLVEKSSEMVEMFRLQADKVLEMTAKIMNIVKFTTQDPDLEQFELLVNRACKSTDQLVAEVNCSPSTAERSNQTSSTKPTVEAIKLAGSILHGLRDYVNKGASRKRSCQDLWRQMEAEVLGTESDSTLGTESDSTQGTESDSTSEESSIVSVVKRSQSYDSVSDVERLNSPTQRIQFVDDVWPEERVVRLIDPDLPDLVPDQSPGLVPAEEEEEDGEEEVDEEEKLTEA